MLNLISCKFFKKDKNFKMESYIGKNFGRIILISFVEGDDVIEGLWEVVEEEKVYNFDVIYFCFIVVNLFF